MNAIRLYWQQQSRTELVPSTIIEGVLSGLLIMFVVSVVATGFVAKRINNISGATYAKAFLATALKNITTVAGVMVAILFWGAEPVVAFAAVYAVIPIIIYKLVFSSMWREAILIWLVVSFVELAAGYTLTTVGIMSLAVFVNG
jgi:hypothetical protein